jgi:hypothetical protein
MGTATVLIQSTEGTCLCLGILERQRWNLEIDEGRANIRCTYCYKSADEATLRQLQMAPISVQLIRLANDTELSVRVRGQHA